MNHRQNIQELINSDVFLERFYLRMLSNYYHIDNIQVQTKLGEKLLNNTSFGERCGIVIAILLVAGTNPIVIDQPEDHLDGKFLSDVLVPLIRNQKLNRQIILITRDANVVVGGDAELIHILADIMRNAFSEQKITYLEDTGKVLYRSAMTHGSNKKNFEIFSAEEFIAAIAQHIPDKHFLMVRYYGWYSSRSRGERIKAGLPRPGHEPSSSELNPEVTVLDVSDHRPRRVTSKTWRELIKKIWEVDPLICPRCGHEMSALSMNLTSLNASSAISVCGSSIPTQRQPCPVKNALLAKNPLPPEQLPLGLCPYGCSLPHILLRTGITIWFLSNT